MLEIEGLHKRLGGRDVLQGLTLRCRPGEIAVILGENGAGKSTLLRVIAGVIEPDRGTVRVAGAPVHGGGVAARRRLGYVPDAAEAIPELHVSELISLVSALKRAAPPSAAQIAQLGVQPFWRQRLGTLSFGQRKRAFLLAALAGDPDLLLLDEPTNGLDPEGVHLIQALLLERVSRAQSTVLTTNDPAFAASLPATTQRLHAGRLSPSSPGG